MATTMNHRREIIFDRASSPSSSLFFVTTLLIAVVGCRSSSASAFSFVSPPPPPASSSAAYVSSRAASAVTRKRSRSEFPQCGHRVVPSSPSSALFDFNDDATVENDDDGGGEAAAAGDSIAAAAVVLPPAAASSATTTTASTTNDASPLLHDDDDDGNQLLLGTAGNRLDVVVDDNEVPSAAAAVRDDLVESDEHVLLIDPTVIVDNILGPALEAQEARQGVDDAAEVNGEAEGSVGDARRSQRRRETVLGEDSNGAVVTTRSSLDAPGVGDSLTTLSADDHGTKSEAAETTAAEAGTIRLAGNSTVESPSVGKILRFAIPAMGVWLCSPILSLIDTSAVGLLAGTAQQAALNPAVSVTDYGGLLVAFMYTATTNLVASAQEEDRTDAPGRQTRTTQAMVTALQLALVVGVVFGSVLGVFGKQLLRTLIGNDAIDPAVFDAALKYVRIRSLGMPAAVVIGSAQSACLGLQDVRSPLYVLLAAAVVNGIGDAMFVGSRHPWIGGAAGAAWATVFSQYAALGLFLKWLRYKPSGATAKRASGGQGREKEEQRPMAEAKAVNVTNAIMELTTDSVRGKPRRKRFAKALRSTIQSNKPTRLASLKLKPATDFFLSSDGRASSSSAKKKNEKVATRPPSSSDGGPRSRGFLAGRFRKRDLLKIRSLETAKEFWPYFVPVTTTSVGRISGYIAMSHVASSALGMVDLAAQQIIFSFFCCFTPMCDSLSLTAQSFVPGIFAKKIGRPRAAALKRTMHNFIKAGGLFGAALFGMVYCIPLLTGFFNTDPLVLMKVNAAIPFLALFFSVHGLVCAGEGILLGQKDLGFLRNSFAAFFFVVPYFLLRLKKRALLGLQHVGVETMWGAFTIYQFIRCSMWLARLFQLQRRTDEGEAVESNI